MKKILIIDDDQIVANIYHNKFAVEGYLAEVAHDGNSGLKLVYSFQPDLLILDLKLPDISGVDVIKKIRSDPAFARMPILVFTNVYQTNLIQAARLAGAEKCLSKASSTPKDMLEVVRHLVGGGTVPPSPALAVSSGETLSGMSADVSDADFQAGLRVDFVRNLPAALHALRGGLQSLVKAPDSAVQLKQVFEIYRMVRSVNNSAGIVGLAQIHHLASALEALLKEIHEKPQNLNASTLRTIASAVDFLGLLFEKSLEPECWEKALARILVVDDDAISRRAIVYALEKAQLKSVSLEHPQQALELLQANDFDLIFLDVDMPVLNGFELCAKLRALPRHKKTPVVFVTGLNDFENRTSSTMAGGNDFIGKPFLFIELTVKSLIHLLRNQHLKRPTLPAQLLSPHPAQTPADAARL